MGDHQFQIRAFDEADNTDPSPVLFSWKIITPAEATEELLDIIASLDLPKGMENSLTAPLNQAIKRLDDNNPKNDGAACNGFSAFLNQVEAKEGSGKLTGEDTELLRTLVGNIQTTLECE